MTELDKIIGRKDVPTEVKEALKVLRSNIQNNPKNRNIIAEMLENSEAKYRTLFHLSPYGILIINLQTGDIIEYNETIHNQLELKEKDIKNISIFNIGFNKKIKEIKSLIEMIRKDGKAFFETNLVTKTGKIRDISVYTQKGKFNGQNVIYAFIIDLTDQKEAEKRLRFKANLLDELSDAVIFIDLDYRILRWNRAAEEIYGWKEEEVLNKSINNVLQTNFLNGQLKNVQSSFYKNGSWRGEAVHKKKDDSSFFTHESIRLVKDTSGKPIAALAIVRDITNQKKLAEELERKTIDLSGRVKELNCLYNLSTLLSEPNKSQTEVFQKIAEIVPSAWQYPDRTCSRVIINDNEYHSGNFKETKWKQSVTVITSGKKIGEIEIFYSEQYPEIERGLYVSEEEELLKTIAGELSRFLERQKDAKDLLWESSVNANLTEVSKAMISQLSLEDISNLVLTVGKNLTGSKFGYVGYIDPKTGYFISTTLTMDVWEICQVRPELKRIIFKEFTGLFGWVLNKKKPILTNDAQNDPRSIGTPEGHIPILKFLSAPALFKGKLVGQVSLANSKEDYSERDLILVKRLANIYALGVERMWTEKAMRESEQKFKDITELSKEIIIRLSLEGSFSYINKAGLDFFNKPLEQLLNSKFTKFVHRNEIEKFNNFFSNIITKKSPVEGFNTTLIIPRGIRIIEWNASPIIESDKVVGIQASGRDITELQEELIEKNKLAAVGTLAAGVAHELNTPLANIKLIAEYLSSLMQNKKPFEIEIFRNELRDIEKEIMLCSKIVTDLLQFSRKIHINPTNIDVKSFFIELVNSPFLKANLDEKKVTIDLKIDKNLKIVGDHSLLIQVFQNIIKNSIESLENTNNPFIKINTKINTLLVEISIIDNGIGIKKEDLPHVFEPFYSTKDVGSGTGLGLSISRGIIEKHGGTIKIDSTFQKGTEVKVNLPKIVV